MARQLTVLTAIPCDAVNAFRPETLLGAQKTGADKRRQKLEKELSTRPDSS